MKELVQNILVYVVIVSVLRGLIGNPKYSQYFQFFSGVIMILIMLSPVLSVLNYENDWYDLLEENILQMDLNDVESEMQIADEHFAAVLEREYEKTAGQQIMAMAKKEGLYLESADVEAANEEGELVIKKIVLVRDDTLEETGENISVKTINIGDEKAVQKEDDSKCAKSLRKEICESFAIGEDKVQIWK